MKKGFLSGFLTALILVGLIGTASATVGRRTVEIDYNNISVTLDGKKVELVDANGKPVEPFAIDGTTYLPVRAVSTALGLGVEWNGTTNTVILKDSKSGEASYPASISFPLHLYSNDGSVYLGKLVTNTYDKNSIWNEYGTYGSQYSSSSIWNEYGTYGSDYSSESAFNEYALKPPIIVDNDGNFFGYLTANQYAQDGYTIFELQQFLAENNQ